MKTRDDLAKSRRIRKTAIEYLGEIPESILRRDASDKSIDLLAVERSYGSRANTGGHQGELAEIFDVSGQSCRGARGALSRFPQNVGRILVLLFSNLGDLVVDPFAGHNSRMELCHKAGRRYVGGDICETFMNANFRVREMLIQERENDLFPQSREHSLLGLVRLDARSLPFRDSIGDFTITSPPYYDLEFYGPEAAQLGNAKTYDDFLQEIGLVALDNFRVLKPGSFCVWCVNDFRRDGRFYSYHEDIASLLRMAGFKHHDTIITDLGPSIRAAFASQLLATRIIPKRHEYCLVFEKPGKPPKQWDDLDSVGFLACENAPLLL